MVALICFVFAIVVSPFKSAFRIEAENAALRCQLIVSRRQIRGRVRLTKNDRLLFIQLCWWFPSILRVLTMILDHVFDRRGTQPAGSLHCSPDSRRIILQ